MPRLKVLFVVSECVPFAKTGGLADVAGALPLALSARGIEIRSLLPAYPQVLRAFPKAKLQRVRVEETNNNSFEYAGDDEVEVPIRGPEKMDAR